MNKTNSYIIIFLLLISYIYSQSNDNDNDNELINQKNKTCTLFEECKNCSFCGNSSNDYSECNFGNIFCHHSDKDNYEYNIPLKDKYGIFFRYDNEINLFCGNEKISLNKMKDSFQILETKFNNNILSKSLHCDYIISNDFYIDNDEDSATLTLEIKNLNSDSDIYIDQNKQLKFTLYMIYKTTANSLRFINLTDNGIRSFQYNRNLDKISELELLIDFENDISSSIEESLIISIITKNQSQKTRLIYIIILVICAILILLIIVLIILYVYIKRKMENDYLQGIEQERREKEEKIKKNKELIQKLFEGNLKGKIFDQKIKAIGCETCTICIEELKIGESIVSITPCNHIFHFECLKKCFETNILNPKCPNCNNDQLSAIKFNIIR